MAEDEKIELSWASFETLQRSSDNIESLTEGLQGIVEELEHLDLQEPMPEGVSLSPLLAQAATIQSQIATAQELAAQCVVNYKEELLNASDK